MTTTINKVRFELLDNEEIILARTWLATFHGDEFDHKAIVYRVWKYLLQEWGISDDTLTFFKSHQKNKWDDLRLSQLVKIVNGIRMHETYKVRILVDGSEIDFE